MIRPTLRMLLFLFGLTMPLLAQEETDPVRAAANQMPISVPTWRGILQDYRVGVGDRLEIQVIGALNLNQTLKVNAAGEISFLPVGPIQVLDLTAAEVESRISSRLLEAKLIQRPEVLVFVRDYQAKRVYVSGELNRPGEFVMSQSLTVMDAVLLAGGLSPFAAPVGYLHRRASGAPIGPPSVSAVEKPEVAYEGIEVVKIDLQRIAEGGPPRPDPALKPGDALIVPRRVLGSFFVLGDVVRPMNYVLPPGKPLLVSQAIANAGGPTATAKSSKGILVRNDENGARNEIKVDFAAILRGKQPDLPVKANDLIFIPGSKIKTITEGYVYAANAMISQAAFRIGRTYQLPDAANQDGNR